MSQWIWFDLLAIGGGALVVANGWRGSGRRRRATIDPARCRRCLACLPACGHDALTADGGHVTVDAARCRGCGDCVEQCPRDAIALVMG